MNKLKSYFFPRLSPKVEEDLSRQSMKSIQHVSLFAMLFELLTMPIFAITRSHFDNKAAASLLNVMFCVVTCLMGYLISKKMLSKPKLNQSAVLLFQVSFYILLSVWGGITDCRHYAAGNQMMTFFAVELMMVCFVQFKPIISTVLMSGAYTGLYLALYDIDRASRIQVFNYFILGIISVFGMMVRFHIQMHLSAKTITLEQSTRMLEYVGRHDILTGLRNRQALEEDAGQMENRQLTAFMIDIDYFKEFNDKNGHFAGDEILKSTGKELRRLYPESFCYRYGGDEFLILSDQTREALYQQDTFRYDLPVGEHFHTIALSIGCAERKVVRCEDLFELIEAADAALYDVKKRTHSPAYGGHDRRKKKLNY